MPKTDLWTRIKEARIVQVLLVYLGASWGILQIVDVLQDALDLPAWVSPVALILLLIGLVIILATAWVQSLPSTTQKEREGEVPGDWQVAPRDLVESISSGDVPHLTWGRSILGGVFALSLMFGLAGVAVVFKGPITSIGPAEAGAGVAPTGIAVVPFDVTGEDLELWKEGMVDVLSTNLDGMGGYRAIDSRTVMARWRERVKGEATPDLQTSLQVAGSTGARYGLVGSLVGNPAGVRVSADVYDLDSGEKLVQSWIEGEESDVLELVGEMSVDLTRKLLEATGADVIQAPRTASLTTHSLPALRSFLEGEAAYRRSDFAGAVAAFEQAVGVDSTFALGWQRLAASYQWLDDISSELGAEAMEKAWENREHLPARDRVLVQADRAMVERDLTILGPLLEASMTYPDDPEVWYLLGDFYYHYGQPSGMASEKDVLECFERAVELDPTFTPYHIHLIEWYIGVADTLKAKEALAAYQRLQPEDDRASGYLPLAVDLFLSGGDRREEVLASLDTVPERALEEVAIFIPWDFFPDRAWTETLAREAFRRTGSRAWQRAIQLALWGQGKLQEYEATLLEPENDGPDRTFSVAVQKVLNLDLTPELLAHVRSPTACREAADPGTDCSFAKGIMAAMDGDRDEWETWVGINRDLATTLEEESNKIHSRGHDAVATALEGAWAYYQGGDLPAARRSLQRASRVLAAGTGVVTRWIYAGVLEEDRPREALEILETLTGPERGFTRVRMGRILEGLGEAEAASEAYRVALSEFSGGDPDNPYLVEAQDGLERVSQ
jgi:tetratricopeptide (TPR) repeat protein